MLTIDVCSPTVADNMALLALSVAGLLRICYAYSSKWRYEYSVLKSSVIVGEVKTSIELFELYY